nr:hypothetical protein [uncultured Flavobacterium sp.]
MNYIQYLTKNGLIKTKQITSVDSGLRTVFLIDNIQEDFFILALFENNIKISGLEFDSSENLDQLAFINSDIFDISTISSTNFFNEQTVVVLSYLNPSINNKINNTLSHDFLINGIYKTLELNSLPDLAKNFLVYIKVNINVLTATYITPVNQLFGDTTLSTTSFPYLFYGYASAPVMASLDTINFYYVPANTPFFAKVFNGTSLPTANKPTAFCFGYSLID